MPCSSPVCSVPALHYRHSETVLEVACARADSAIVENLAALTPTAQETTKPLHVQAPPIENLSALPADDFLAVLPSATSLLAQITPTNSGNNTGDAAVAGAVGAVPDAWAALASVRLVDAVAQPLLGAQAAAARAGSEPGSLLQTQVEALFAVRFADLQGNIAAAGWLAAGT